MAFLACCRRQLASSVVPSSFCVPAERVQHLDGVSSSVLRYEKMVVKASSDDVAADALLSESCRKGHRQTHCFL